MDTQLAKKEAELETTNKAIKGLREAEWYKHFSEGLRAQVVETEFNIRSDYIKLYHEIGQQIVEKIGDFKREKVYGQHIAEVVAQDIGKSKSSVEKSIQFYQMYPHLGRFLEKEGKELSWYKITQKYLPKPSEKVKKVEGVNEFIPPEISLVWNKEQELWDIKIKEEDLGVINLLGFKKQIDEYFSKQAGK